jgi:hypothetical protein
MVELPPPDVDPPSVIDVALNDVVQLPVPVTEIGAPALLIV